MSYISPLEVELKRAIGLIKSLIDEKSSQYPHYHKMLLKFEKELDKLYEEEKGKKKRKEKNDGKS